MTEEKKLELRALEVELVSHRADATQLSLCLPDEMTFDAWAELGKKLRHAGRMLHWWIGDWAAFGERKFGKLAEFAVVNGMSVGALKAMASVSDAVPPERRRPQLEWSFHEAVAALKPTDQSKWLEQAIQDHQEIGNFRKAIRLSLGESYAGEKDSPPSAGLLDKQSQIKAALRDKPAEFWTPDVITIWEIEADDLKRIVTRWRQ